MRRRDAFRFAAALAGVPFAANAATPAPALPPTSLLTSEPERYWARIREEQFLLPRWRNFLNNGSVGPTPKPVLEAVVEYLTQAATLNRDEYHRWGYETLDAEREEMAKFIGCTKDSLAFMHSATEAMSTVASGLDLKTGDEILLTDQEHPSGRGCWYQKAKRHGLTVREVPIPLPPKNPEQVADLMISAIGPRTRVLSFSGITTHTGLITPIRQICDAARAKGVLSVVDGAHMVGQVPMDISQYGCDFLVSSPHKWLFAPAGSGLLYIREEHLERLWPSITTTAWDDPKLKAARFMMVGTNNRAIFVGMIAGLRFARELGPERIYQRTHELARRVREQAAALPYIELLTPDDDRMYGALVTFHFRSPDVKPFLEECQKRRIWIAGGERQRVSTHIHTRPQDIEEFFEVIRNTMGKKA